MPEVLASERWRWLSIVNVCDWTQALAQRIPCSTNFGSGMLHCLDHSCLLKPIAAQLRLWPSVGMDQICHQVTVVIAPSPHDSVCWLSFYFLLLADILPFCSGSFLTEAQHADVMEGMIANWYYAGLQALQVSTLHALSLSERNLRE